MKWDKMCAKLNVLTLFALFNVYKKWTKNFYTNVMGDELTSCSVKKTQNNVNSLFICAKFHCLQAYGGRNDKANLPDRCTKSG